MNKTVFVTGATSGFGKAIATLFAQKGFDIIINGRRNDRLQALKQELEEDAEGNLIVRCGFTDFGNMQKALEERGLTVISSELEWIPENTVSITDEQAEDVFKLIARVEEDDDVQQVFHNMA